MERIIRTAQSVNNSLSTKDKSQKKTVRDFNYPKGYKVYIPNNIDLQTLLEHHPIKIRNAQDYLAYLLHTIHSVPAFTKDTSYEDNDNYVALSSSLLQDRVAKYFYLFVWLEDLGIILIQPSYRPGSSMGYKFTDDYRVELKEYVITTKTLIKSILTWKKPKRDPILKPEDLFGYIKRETFSELLYTELAEDRLQYLRKYLNPKFKLNKYMAQTYLNALKVEEEKYPAIDAVFRFNCRMLIVNEWVKGSTRFKIDSTAGRLHTNLVSLKSQLRGALTYEDQPLASADIRNSQPLLSLTLLNYELFKQNDMLRRIIIYNKLFKNDLKNNINSHSNMLLNYIRTQSNAPDIILYRELVLSGQIYEYFGNVLLREGLVENLQGSELRKYAKNQLFQTLFNKNQAIRYTPALRVFKNIFPTVHEIFRKIKFKKHNTLACILQNLEAEIVLFKVCGDIASINPNIPMFTIHDSIATTIDHIEFVEQKLSQHLQNAIQAIPQIKVEIWNESLLEDISISIPSSKNTRIKEAFYGYYFYDFSISLRELAKLLQTKKMTLIKTLRGLSILDQNNHPDTKYKYLEYFEYGRIKGGGQFTKVNPNGVNFIKKLAEKHPDLFPKDNIV